MFPMEHRTERKVKAEVDKVVIGELLLFWGLTIKETIRHSARLEIKANFLWDHLSKEKKDENKQSQNLTELEKSSLLILWGTW